MFLPFSLIAVLFLGLYSCFSQLLKLPALGGAVPSVVALGDSVSLAPSLVSTFAFIQRPSLAREGGALGSLEVVELATCHEEKVPWFPKYCSISL